MLIILSDLHLNDGSTGETISPEAFALFADRLRELALTASWRNDGVYRPIEQIDLVLLGDVFDLLHSSRWHNVNAGKEDSTLFAEPHPAEGHGETTAVKTEAIPRPWDDPQSPALVDLIGRITADILAQNQDGLATLRALADGHLTLPPLLRVSRPVTSADEEPVRVRIHYMVGDHDWFYHLPGAAYSTVRQQVVKQLGLANRGDQPFPHDITENGELLQAMRRHKVIARHGDAFDPLCYEGDRGVATLGDALELDLVGRFAVEVEQVLGHELPDATMVAFREINDVFPRLLLPAWIEGVLERTCPQPAARKRVKQLWDRLAEELLASRMVREHSASGSAILVDGLSRALRFSKRLSTGWAANTVRWLRELRGAESDSLAAHALTEPDFRNRRARHVVYGHTHAAEIVPLDASHAEGYTLDQIYFNAGTWRRTFRSAAFAPSGQEFIASDIFGYLAFFQGDERKGRTYEAWTGTFGPMLGQRAIHRIDAGRTPLAAYLTMQPPHFNSLLSKVDASRR